MNPLKVGIIGCGMILWAYAEGNTLLPQFEIVGCADIYPEKAKAAEEKYGFKAYESVEALLDDKEIELVINLTIPAVHAMVDKQILNAGKHVYSEKPLGIDLAQAKEVLDLAKEKNLLVGCAPETFMGAGLQSAIKYLNDGVIGDIYFLKANMIGGGPDNWHNTPDFFFKPGGGPILDMGPYYITAMIAMFGPVRSVIGKAFKAREKRFLYLPKERLGDYIDVEIPTTTMGLYSFDNNITCDFTCSFDACGGTSFCPFEVYGSKGTMKVPDPNSIVFDPVKVKLEGQDEIALPYLFDPIDYKRGLGVADMAMAIREGRKHRASGELAYHALEAMLAIYPASDEKREVVLESTCEKPAPMPGNLGKYMID